MKTTKRTATQNTRKRQKGRLHKTHENDKKDGYTKLYISILNSSLNHGYTCNLFLCSLPQLRPPTGVAASATRTYGVKQQ